MAGGIKENEIRYIHFPCVSQETKVVLNFLWERFTSQEIIPS